MKIIIKDITNYDTSSQMRRLNSFLSEHHSLPLNVSVRIQHQPKAKDCGWDFAQLLVILAIYQPLQRLNLIKKKS